MKGVALLLLFLCHLSCVASQITMRNMANALGVNPRNQLRTTNTQAAWARGTVTAAELGGLTFFGPSGIGGLGVFDYDGDGDEDIVFGNNINVNNTIWRNNLIPTGNFTFTDVTNSVTGLQMMNGSVNAMAAGDLDNDGDIDIVFISGDSFFQVRPLENLGNGNFVERSALSGAIFQNPREAVNMALADVNGDGLLDMVVVGLYESGNFMAFTQVAFCCSSFNRLFLNQGGFRFIDNTDASRINVFDLTPSQRNPGFNVTGPNTYPTFTVNAFDYDLDGDVDLVFGGDQGAFPASAVQLGTLDLARNDGAGVFTAVRLGNTGMNITTVGGWMGGTFGDWDCNGIPDMFHANVGGLVQPPLDSRAWFGTNNPNNPFATFVEAYHPTAWGWSSSTIDYDNDGDQDVLWVGNFQTGAFMVVNNPGSVMENQGSCSGNFTLRTDVVANYSRFVSYSGTSVDINQDGFDDFVSFVSVQIPQTIPEDVFVQGSGPYNLQMINLITGGLGAVGQLNSGAITSTGVNTAAVNALAPGPAIIDINSANNGNRWSQVQVIGSAGILPGGNINRVGAGAVLFFQPFGMRQIIHFVEAGGRSFTAAPFNVTFGLGQARGGILQVMWPGGLRTPNFVINATNRVRIPHIPCSLATDGFTCVENAVAGYVSAGLLTTSNANFLLATYAQALAANATLSTVVPVPPSAINLVAGQMLLEPVPAALSPIVGTNLGVFRVLNQGTGLPASIGSLIIVPSAACQLVPLSSTQAGCVVPATSILAFVN